MKKIRKPGEVPQKKSRSLMTKATCVGMSAKRQPR